MTINGIPHQLFAAGLQAREIYPELSKYFYKENTDVTWEDFLTTKFAYGLIHVRTLIKHFMAAAEQCKKSGRLLQIKKAPEASGDLMCYVFSLEDSVTHLSATNPSGILTIEK